MQGDMPPLTAPRATADVAGIGSGVFVDLDGLSLTLDTAGMFRTLGVFGFLLYIGSFAALQLRVIDGNSMLYTLLNLGAAALVLVSLIHEFNLASALIQTSWIVIGLVGVVLRLRS